ncbi:hypothetical protein ACTXKN_12450 [Brachybacterium alimentarium]|uniref:hypothetical protein n=1 Tax=Brachybacterium alimentarium TaxID=47845 RepID=UPI003FD4DFF3
MKPVITRHNNTWRVHIGNHLTGAWATKERAQKHAANIESVRIKKRGITELEQAAEALRRMDERRPE